jgi:hypothetical protein
MGLAMSKTLKKTKAEDIETEPDAWQRFEHAVDAAVKTDPKPRKNPVTK